MLPYLFVILAVASRFLILRLHSHPWDFTPLSASLLFFGAYASRRRAWFPVALFAVTDVVLSKFVYGYPISWDLYVTWAWYAAIVLLGTRLSEHSRTVWVLASALASSVSFFLVSNFAAFLEYDMYPKTRSGLMACYAAGLPFFQHRVVGDLLFTAVFFAVPVIIAHSRKKVSGDIAAI
jgi:Family of unknown function (DUF6580)